MNPTIAISLVSHGHGDEVQALLAQLAALQPPALRRVWLTFNRPEPAVQATLAAAVWPFELHMHLNPQPLSFAANHNQAFKRDEAAGGSSTFIVMNPDIQLHNGDDAITTCHQALQAAPGAGAVWPRQVDAAGVLQDHARRLPTPRRLLARHLFGKKQEHAPDQQPDWVNGAFVALRPAAFAAVGGFDERYRMYCEDVDLCLRLQLAGWPLQAADTTVTHVAARSSHRRLRHLVWHLQSLWRLWRSEAFAAYREQPD